MKRTTYLAVACLLGGLMVATTLGGLQGPARAADVAALAANPLDVVINEVAWMGTQASASDEWIELYNNTDSAIDIGSWSISGADTGVCLNFSTADGFTTTTVPARGYLIYANHEDDVRDNVGTNVVDIWDATIGMNNTSPGQMILYDAPDCGGNAIDTINQATGDWFAGDSGGTRTMERKDPTASGTDAANWATNDPLIASNGQDADGNPINGTPKARNSCYQSPVADLDIVKTGPDTVDIGSLITYHLTLANVGTITATGVRITDTLPAGLSFVAQTGPFAFTRLGRTLTWNAGDVASGTFYITVTGRVAGTVVPTLTLTNRVTATTTATETVTANNTDSWDTTVTIPGQADLVVVKTGPPVTTPGDTLMYHITLSNTGTITATDVRLTDTLPVAVDFVTQTSPYAFDRSGRRLVWQLGDVLTGARYLITVTTQVSDTAALTLTNQITATTAASETVTANNTDAWATAVDTQVRVYLPLVLRNYVPPRYDGMIIEAVLYDGLQTSDPDEAVLLLNGSRGDVDLSGWELCKMEASDWSCTDLPAVTVAPRQRL
jgi:uncharacterized repeat protein (TIGR01451 family)